MNHVLFSRRSKRLSRLLVSGEVDCFHGIKLAVHTTFKVIMQELYYIWYIIQGSVVCKTLFCFIFRYCCVFILGFFKQTVTKVLKVIMQLSFLCEMAKKSPNVSQRQRRFLRILQGV